MDKDKLKSTVEAYNKLSPEVKKLLNNNTIELYILIKEIKEKGENVDIPELQVTEEFKAKLKAEEEKIITKWQESNKTLLAKDAKDVNNGDKKQLKRL